MRIGLLSPSHHAGVTTASLMLGYTIAQSQSKEVCLTYTGEKSDIKDYVGIVGNDDVTCSISQVMKLLEANAISKNDISEYCTKMGPNCELLDSGNGTINNDEAMNLLSFVFKTVPKDFVLCDISSDLSDDITQALIKECDILIMVTTPDSKALNAANEWLNSDYWPKDKPTMLLVNRYDPEIMALSEIAKRVGIPFRNTCKISYNPWITKTCITGKLDTMVPFILARDPRVIELNVDLKECLTFVFSHNMMKIKWEV